MKRIIASALLLCLIATALPLNGFATVASSETAVTEPTTASETSEPTSPPTTEPPSTLPPETDEEPTQEDLLYSALYAVIKAAKGEYIYSAPAAINHALLARLCGRLLDETPEFFYFEAISVETTSLPAPDEAGNLYRYRFVPEYNLSGDALADAQSFVELQVDAILSEIPERSSQLEQLLFLHDYICTHFAYHDDPQSSARDIYRFLQSGKGVCQSYAKLYAHLLNQLGIENRFVTSVEMNHMWNQVKLDGEWYHVDLTWDDPVVDQAGRALHTNFLRSDSGIAQTAHYSFTAPYPCTSTRFENSFLPDLTGAVAFLNREVYGVSSSARAIVRLDLQNLTATPVADISNLRWTVWNSPGSTWKEQYLNLYSDGILLYFNGPSSIWSFDPAIGELQLLYGFNSADGYLYSLFGNGHQLTCTVSKAPGAPLTSIYYTTPHIYESEGGGFFTTEFCVICGHAEAFVSPNSGDFLTACISTRPASAGLHDLRLALLVDSAMLESSAPLTVKLSLFAGEEERFVTSMLSASDHGNFLVYERIVANGLNYSVAEGYTIYGLLLQNLAGSSYDRVEVSVTCEEIEIYRAALTAAQIFSPADSPVTDTDEAYSSSDADLPATPDAA